MLEIPNKVGFEEWDKQGFVIPKNFYLDGRSISSM